MERAGLQAVERQEEGAGRSGRGRERKRQARSAADSGATVAAVAAQDTGAPVALNLPAARKRMAKTPAAAAAAAGGGGGAGEASTPFSRSGAASEAEAGEGEAVLGGKASALMASLHAVNGCSSDPPTSLALAHLTSPPTCLSLSETADIRLPLLAQGQRFSDAYRVVVLIESREKG
ncbi:hypothetical protein CLOP_g1370 [Closterium sp. NIES-67]|nr:hypothetical protein CLOP_g1370 [Closterium sp. NIES-67]